MSSGSTTSLLPQTQDNDTEKESLLSGDHVKSVVYAGLDAIVTSFSLISSISANHLSSVDVLVLGFANLIADAISMAFGDYMSSSAEMDMAEQERSRTARNVAEPDHALSQQLELLHTYQSLGMDLEDANTIVTVFSKYKDILVDEKMMAEKGMLPPRRCGERPWKAGVITFFAFIVFGSAPLFSFVALIPFTDDDGVKFAGACILSAVSLGVLGLAKARVSGQRYLYSMVVTLFNGCIAAASAYLLGWILRNVAGLHE